MISSLVATYSASDGAYASLQLRTRLSLSNVLICMPLMLLIDGGSSKVSLATPFLWASSADMSAWMFFAASLALASLVNTSYLFVLRQNDVVFYAMLGPVKFLMAYALMLVLGDGLWPPSFLQACGILITCLGLAIFN